MDGFLYKHKTKQRSPTRRLTIFEFEDYVYRLIYWGDFSLHDLFILVRVSNLEELSKKLV